jgi:hypothetical protein
MGWISLMGEVRVVLASGFAEIPGIARESVRNKVTPAMVKFLRTRGFGINTLSSCVFQ